MLSANTPESSRQQTDESLLDERTRTDGTVREQAEEQRSAESLARHDEQERSDARTQRARAFADGHRDGGGAASPILQREREASDAVLDAERGATELARSDEIDRLERLVIRLFDKERQKTDRSLRSERDASDDEMNTRLRYLTIVGHDLRSMLTAVATQAAILSRVTSATAEARALAGGERIARVTRRMARLVADLVDVSTMASGELKIVLARADLGEGIRDTVELLLPQADECGVTLLAEPTAGPVVGTFDAERILQVLGNLTSNALKFTPRGGRVTLSARADGDFLQVAVDDTGVGVPADKVEAIFAPFQQLDAPQDGSLGLGLHIARTIVEAHGGTLVVEERRGPGIRFVLRLPRRRSGR